MSDVELFRVRIALLQAFLREGNYDGVLLSRVDNFAMATGGKRNYVYKMGEIGVCSLFVTASGQVYYVGNTIEAPRIMDEELQGSAARSASSCGSKPAPPTWSARSSAATSSPTTARSARTSTASWRICAAC